MATFGQISSPQGPAGTAGPALEQVLADLKARNSGSGAVSDAGPRLKRAERQPLGAVHLYGGVYVKEMLIPDRETLVPQHAHTYAHLSYLAAGSVAVWRDGEMVGAFDAPSAIRIPARAKHSFLSLSDNTLVLCIHAVADGEDVSIEEEHHLALED